MILSDRELASSVDSLPPPGLSSVPETTSMGQVRPRGADSDDDWSVIGDEPEADVELSGNEGGGRWRGSVVGAIPEEPGSDGLGTEDDTTPRQNRTVYSEGAWSIRQTPLLRVWDRRPRNSSSPSRSPARRSFVNRRTAIKHGPPRGQMVKSFYLYLFGDV